MSLENYLSEANCCPSHTSSTDNNGHGQLLNAARTDLLLALLSDILRISKGNKNLEGFSVQFLRLSG